MANNFETAIDQMMTELHYLKETAIDSNVLVVDKSQISVESTADSNKLVIHLNVIIFLFLSHLLKLLFDLMFS